MVKLLAARRSGISEHREAAHPMLQIRHITRSSIAQAVRLGQLDPTWTTVSALLNRIEYIFRDRHTIRAYDRYQKQPCTCY